MIFQMGKIDGCLTAKCGFRCCEFHAGNYIVLYPDELEEARSKGTATEHLIITDENYNGGKKAVCTAKYGICCDGGLKPFDCISYPFFPVIDEATRQITGRIRGKKCPLRSDQEAEHWVKVRGLWTELVHRKPEVAPWLAKVEMVGYTPVERVARERPPVFEVRRAVA